MLASSGLSGSVGRIEDGQGRANGVRKGVAAGKPSICSDAGKRSDQLEKVVTEDYSKQGRW